MNTYLVRRRTLPLVTSGLHPRVFCSSRRRLVFTTLVTVCRTNGGVSVLAIGRRLTHHKGLSTVNKPCTVIRLDDGITSSTRVRCRTRVVRRGCLTHRVIINFGGLLAYTVSRAVSVSSALVSTRGLLSHLRNRSNRGTRVHSVRALVTSAVRRTREHVTGDIGNIANVPANLARLSGGANNLRSGSLVIVTTHPSMNGATFTLRLTHRTTLTKGTMTICDLRVRNRHLKSH